MVKWIATLSDGSTVVEHSREWGVIEGERKPWVRLTQFLENSGLYLTSLRLIADGKTIHLPKDKFDRFSYINYSIAPDFYSLKYHMEGEFGDDGAFGEKNFVDVIAHYGELAIHMIYEVDGDNEWIVVTKGDDILAPTPKRN